MVASESKASGTFQEHRCYILYIRLTDVFGYHIRRPIGRKRNL
jgi:hypothetical protein